MASPSAPKYGSRAVASLTALSKALVETTQTTQTTQKTKIKSADDALADSLREDFFSDEGVRPKVEDLPPADMSDITPKTSPRLVQSVALPPPVSEGILLPPLHATPGPSQSAEEARWSWYRQHASAPCIAQNPSLELFSDNNALPVVSSPGLTAVVPPSVVPEDPRLLDEYAPAAVPSGEVSVKRKKQKWFTQYYGNAGAERPVRKAAEPGRRKGRPLQRMANSVGPVFKPLPKAALPIEAPPWLHVGRDPPDVDVLLSPLPS